MPNNAHLPGAAVYRGPMASDNYVQIHNLIVRSRVIHTRYVGVWGYISSHEEGWKLTEKKIAKDLQVGRDFVRSALHAFEAAHCLIRTQERGADGTFDDAAWFITDLPFQLRHLGIFDEDDIDRRVADAFAQWQENRRSEPMSENPTPDGEPSGAPMSEKPTSDKPTSDNTTQRRSRVNKTKGKKRNSSSSTPSPHTSQADQSLDTTGEEEEQREIPSIPTEVSTDDETNPLLERFWQELPNEVTPHATAQAKISGEISALLAEPNAWGESESGPEELAGWFARRIPSAPVGNPAGWLRSQCRYAPAGPDEAFMISWDNCPHGCDENQILTEYDADGNEKVKRCPVTHRRDQHEPGSGKSGIAASIQQSLGSAAESAPAGAFPPGLPLPEDVPF